MYLFAICHAGKGGVIQAVNGLNAHDAYDAFVAMNYGNGVCPFQVDVVAKNYVVSF
ncbi:MAG: hypothetical protein AAF959_18695 [Cyanobacteria bacterium P01_D01_bin.56]